MGDRIGIMFKTPFEVSDLYAHSHWGGRALLVAAQIFQREKAAEGPITSLTKADALVREFAEWCVSTGRFDPDDVDVCDTADGYEDCEDNGVFVIDMVEGYVSRAGPQTPSPFWGMSVFWGSVSFWGARAFFSFQPSPMLSLHGITLIYP